MIRPLANLVICGASAALAICPVFAQQGAPVPSEGSAQTQPADGGLDLKGSLAIPVVVEPALKDLDTSKQQSWRRATMSLSGSMCPACLMELEGKLKHTLGVTFAKVNRETTAQAQESGGHHVASAVVIYDLRFANLKKIEACVKDDKYKPSDLAESSQW
ncbi:MAG TPA: heavy-metal-associated domain-containing protein [Planktothrix sp.]